jgi:hypothetical protein
MTTPAIMARVEALRWCETVKLQAAKVGRAYAQFEAELRELDECVGRAYAQFEAELRELDECVADATRAHDAVAAWDWAEREQKGVSNVLQFAAPPV